MISQKSSGSFQQLLEVWFLFFQSSANNGTFPPGLIPGSFIPRASWNKGFLVPHPTQAPDMDNFSHLFHAQVPGLVKGHFTIQVGIPEAPEQLQGWGSTTTSGSGSGIPGFSLDAAHQNLFGDFWVRKAGF